MGQKLHNYYLESAKIGGINARTRLSILTKMTSMQAKGVLDTPELVREFDKAFKIIENEFNKKPSTEEGSFLKSQQSDNSSSSLRKQISIFSDLLASRSLSQNDLRKGLERITETLAGAIDVERASVWFYDNDKTQIECADLYERNKGTHSSGIVLKRVDFPNYFKTIENERTLAAHDAHTHYGTKEFTESYLKPLGIRSMLDAPLWVNGKMVGVLCHEHIGPKRSWNRDEENFAYLVSSITSILLENRQTETVI